MIVEILVNLLVASVVFLMFLNGYLRGLLKDRVDLGLKVLWLLLVATTYYFLGIRAGITVSVLSFAYGALTRSLAAAIAARLLGFRTELE